MDIQRPDFSKKKRRKRAYIVGGIAAAVIVLGVLLFSLEPPLPKISRESIWIDKVKRGDFAIRVRGVGTLVPENSRWITAQTTGRVDKIHLLPGTPVESGSLIMELQNSELEQQLHNAELELTSAQAQLRNQRIREQDALLEMEFQLAQLEAQYENAKVDIRVNKELFEEGLIAERDLLRSQTQVEQLKRQTSILKRRFESRKEQVVQNLEPFTTRVEQERARVELLRHQVERLMIRSGQTGILQRLPLEEGEQVTAGQALAQVADPSRLKATIQIPETQAKDVQIGQRATIDTRNGIVEGEVMRVNPTVEEGTVDVDVRLLSELPRGARADLTVEGKIELMSLSDVVYMARPLFAREDSSGRVFRIDPSTNTADRVTVQFGRSSIGDIEILSGLYPGDEVILSDTGEWNEHKKIQIR